MNGFKLEREEGILCHEFNQSKEQFILDWEFELVRLQGIAIERQMHTEYEPCSVNPFPNDKFYTLPN